MRERAVDWDTAAWLVWRLERNGCDARCIIGLTPYGPQTRFMYDGQLIAEYLFDSWSEASAWSSQRRSELESEGWMVDSSSLGRRATGTLDMSDDVAMGLERLHVVARSERRPPTTRIQARLNGRRVQ
jgi:hypothetical protein